MRIENLQNKNRKYAKSIGNFHVLEYVQDASVSLERHSRVRLQKKPQLNRNILVKAAGY